MEARARSRWQARACSPPASSARAAGIKRTAERAPDPDCGMRCTRRTSKAFPGSSGHEPAITMTGAREVCVSGCRNPLPDPENLPWSCRAARVLSPSSSFLQTLTITISPLSFYLSLPLF